MALPPLKLAIYYGYPGLVNGANGNITTAVNTFKVYDQLVFGTGLEENSHPDHTNTVNIIADSNMINTKVYGEIDSTIGLSMFKNKVDKWKAMGAQGIFCNKFGYDYGVTRAQQNNMLNYIHSKSLSAFVNAWVIDDVFGTQINLNNPTGTASVINSTDWYLAQSYQIIVNSYQTASDWKTKSDKMVTYRQTFGTKMACITTTDNTNAFDQNKMDYAYYSAALYAFNSFGWGEYNFSAPNSLLPFRIRKVIYGTRVNGSIINHSPVFERMTNVGIHIDTSTHTVSTLLD